jgi:hypothetical protein
MPELAVSSRTTMHGGSKGKACCGLLEGFGFRAEKVPRVHHMKKLRVFTSRLSDSNPNTASSTKGIYEHRWGDAPIHLLAVATLLPESQVPHP